MRLDWQVGRAKGGRDLRFKKRIAPSRHSGLSSLSPKEPNNSLTTMSASSGSTRDRMSPNNMPTSFSLHSEAFRCCRLKEGGHGYIKSIWVMSTVNLRYIGAGILLYRIYKCFAIDARNGAQTPRDERPPSCSRHTDNTRAVPTSHVCDDSTSVLLTSFPMQANRVERRTQPTHVITLYLCLNRVTTIVTYLFILLIFYGILFERLISDSLQVIHKGL
jgi:hypothetical protein